MLAERGNELANAVTNDDAAEIIKEVRERVLLNLIVFEHNLRSVGGILKLEILSG